MAKRGTIKINWKKNDMVVDRVEVPALIFGHLAVHKMLDRKRDLVENCWNVSHVLSGMKLGAPFSLQRDARRLALALTDRPEWAKIDKDGKYPNKAEFKALGEIVREAAYKARHPDD
ncbi:MAG: hypothetical protein V3S71_02785 [Acidobacteriota bacterium]